MKQVEGLWVPDSDNHFSGFDYELGTRREVLKFVPEDRRGLALDIGAHVGIWTRFLADHFDRVIAFEPVPENLACLRKNTEHQTNVEIRPSIVSDSPGIKYMSRGRPDNSGMWGVSESGVAFGSSITVDSLSFTGVDFVKMDIEQHEPEALAGALKTIWRDLPVICVELKNVDTNWRVHAILDSAYNNHRIGSEVIFYPK